MKIIDQTPLLDANGKLNIINRVQGMLKYGLSWPSNLEAQEKVIAVLNKVIEKGYTLFRNQQLGASEIIVPLILVGPSGVYVMEATPLKGVYRARGEEWGTVTNDRFQPADINILSRTARLAKILQIFFERQGVKLAAPVEPVLLAAEPGLHIESVRPAVRVVMSDAINHFAASLLTARPVYNSTQTAELVERIQKPRSARAAAAEAAQPPPEDAFTVQDETPFPSPEPSRLQAILNAPKSDALIENAPPAAGPSELDFALEESPAASQPTVLVSNPTPGESASAPRRFLGMTVPQIVLLGVMSIFELCILIGFGALIYFNR